MILIVCHDAGGAEIVSNYIKNKKIKNCIYCIKGPAIRIFKKNIKNFNNRKTIKKFSKIRKLLIGTSIKSKHELRYLNQAKKLNIYTFCFLDHWTNYKRKLTLNKKIILPNEFLVGDIYSKNIAKKIFKTSKITLIKNPYFEEIFLKIKMIKKKNKKENDLRILYLTEPLRNQAKYLYNDYQYYGYDEFSALENFLKHIYIIKDRIAKLNSINIRLHPSESNIKYNKLLMKYNKLNLKISKEKDLIKDIILNNYIVGCETTALVVALFAKKKVFCSIPKKGKKSSLPYKNIMHISKLRNYLNA